MSARFCDVARYAAVSLTVAVAFSFTLLLSCTEERPLQPVPRPEPLVHEPWEDEEAENLAWLISGELCAPLDLYGQIDSNLTQIRSQFGDSLRFAGPDGKWLTPVSVLSETHHWPRFAPNGVEFDVEPHALEDMSNGTYHDWDSLNALFSMNVRFHYGFPFAGTTSRINPYRVIAAYEPLRGVRAVYPGGLRVGDASNIYALRHDWGIAYLICYAWGDCSVGCAFRQYYYFRVRQTGIEYVGECFDPRWRTPPTWWSEAKACEDLWREGDAAYRYRDVIPPAAARDLRVVRPQDGTRATIAFTSPGNDGFDGQAYSYIVRWDTIPLNEANWNAMTGPSEFRPITSFTASATGTEVALDLTRLYAHAVNYIAVRTQDGRGNLAPISNVVTSR